MSRKKSVPVTPQTSKVGPWGAQSRADPSRKKVGSGAKKDSLKQPPRMLKSGSNTLSFCDPEINRSPESIVQSLQRRLYAHGPSPRTNLRLGRSFNLPMSSFEESYRKSQTRMLF